MSVVATIPINAFPLVKSSTHFVSLQSACVSIRSIWWCGIPIKRTMSDQIEENEKKKMMNLVCIDMNEDPDTRFTHTNTHSLFSLSLEHLQMHTLKLLGVHHPFPHTPHPYIYWTGPQTEFTTVNSLPDCKLINYYRKLQSPRKAKYKPKYWPNKYIPC